jgi:hypothetical protein
MLIRVHILSLSEEVPAISAFLLLPYYIYLMRADSHSHILLRLALVLSDDLFRIYH